MARYNLFSKHVVWIKNCSAYSEPMTSHAVGGLAAVTLNNASDYRPNGLTD